MSGHRYLYLAACLLALAARHCCSADYDDDIARLSSGLAELGPIFKDTDVGPDLHSDAFYYVDEPVSEAYRRAKFATTKVSLAGQRANASLVPWAVGQRSGGIQLLSNLDRWDVKSSHEHGLQLVAVYQGSTRGGFVVNKVRAHLLRRLANVLAKFVPLLERSAQPDARHVDLVHDQVRKAVEEVFRDVDRAIRDTMYEQDGSWASATVAVVTRHHVITASVGTGAVYAFTNRFKTVNLTPNADDEQVHNVFGAKKQRQFPLQAHVEVHRRSMRLERPAGSASGPDHDSDYDSDSDDDDDDDSVELLFLVLETPVVNSMVGSEAASTVVSIVNSMAGRAQFEEDMLKESVKTIVEAAKNKVEFLKRLQLMDFSVALVALETDYTKIH